MSDGVAPEDLMDPHSRHGPAGPGHLNQHCAARGGRDDPLIESGEGHSKFNSTPHRPPLE